MRVALQAQTAEPKRPRWLLLANANFRHLCSAHLISMFGDGVYNLALPWYVYQHTGSGLATALTWAAGAIPYLLVGLFAGVYIDRWPRKRTLIGADLLRAATLLLLPLVLLGGFNMAAVIAMAVILPSFGRFFVPAQRATTPLLVDGDDLVPANATMEGAGYAAYIAGPVVGGLLLAVTTVVPLLFLDAATFVVSALLIAAIRLPHGEVSPLPAQNMRRELAEGLKISWRTPALRTLGLVAAFTVALWATVAALLPLWVGREADGGSGRVGVLLSAMFVGALCASIGVARRGRRLNRGAMVMAGMLGMGFAIGLFGVARQLVPGVLAMAALGFAMNVYNVGVLTLLQRFSPANAMGRVLAVNDACAWSLRPFVVVGAGVLADRAGVHATLIGISGALLMCGLVSVAAGSLTGAEPIKQRAEAAY